VAMGGGGRLATIPESPTHNKLLLVNGGGDDYSAAARRVGIMGGNEFSQPPRPARNVGILF
jgi:hypothetical protein